MSNDSSPSPGLPAIVVTLHGPRGRAVKVAFDPSRPLPRAARRALAAQGRSR